jgi:hypothetical protein
MAGLLDGVIIKFSKDVESRDHLVIVERNCRSAVGKHENAPEHGGRRPAEDFLDRLPEGLFVFRVFRVVVLATRFTFVTDSRYVGVNATVTPSAAPGLVGIPHIAGYQSIPRVLLLTASGHRGVRLQSCGGQLSN